MSFAIDRILIFLAILLLVALFMGTHAIDAEHSIKLSQDEHSPELFHLLAKRRFLPTRRRSTQQILDDLSDENDDDEIHFNNKRYFLKSKRYFLNSKRFTEPKDE